MAEYNCALNHDGSLKDASKIQWHYNPDDVMPLPKNNKRARIEKTFLDIEAKVTSHSEGKEDDEDMDRFIYDEDEDEDEEDPNTPLVKLWIAYTQVEGTFLQVYKLDNALIIIANVTMYVNSSPSSHIGAVLPVSGTSSSSAVSKHSIPQCNHNPTKDWALWDVVVKNGSEEDMVFSFSLHGSSKYIHSAFLLLVIPGHIYVEARCLNDLKTSTKILADVYQNSTQLTMASSGFENGRCMKKEKRGLEILICWLLK
ncbi:hypothetical protein BDQ17DRAFT_1432410 [Cyathus striatus]|nr:hypothetical protein BDQ17DRAFT_1432410 [Cyathus striatus]